MFRITHFGYLFLMVQVWCVDASLSLSFPPTKPLKILKKADHTYITIYQLISSYKPCSVSLHFFLSFVNQVFTIRIALRMKCLAILCVVEERNPCSPVLLDPPWHRLEINSGVMCGVGAASVGACSLRRSRRHCLHRRKEMVQACYCAQTQKWLCMDVFAECIYREKMDKVWVFV